MKESIFTEQFARVVSLAESGERSAAVAALKEITQLGTPRGSASVSKAREAAILARDHYMCRYCGFRMISIPIMRAVAALFPDDFKYHKNWKAAESDVAFWRDCTSVDHVMPATRGGSSDIRNLVAACWPCNSSKGNLTLAELGRDLLPISAIAWDGLSGQLGGLMSQMPSQLPYFRNWLQALRHPEKI